MSPLKCPQDFQKASGRKSTSSQGRPSAPSESLSPSHPGEGAIPLKLSSAGPSWGSDKQSQTAFNRGKVGFSGKKTKEQREE